MKWFVLFLILLPSCLFSQTNRPAHSKDTTLFYDASQEYYFLKINGYRQIIMFDSVKYDNNRPVTILIENNTKDTLRLYIKSLQSPKQVMKENSTRYLFPGEYYSISPIFNHTRYQQSSLLNSHFYFEYVTKNDTIQFIFQMKGNICLETLPQFDSLSKATDVPIARTTFPKTPSTETIGSINTATVKDSFVFNKNVLFQINNTEFKPLDDLLLRYRINSGEDQLVKNGESLDFEIPCDLYDTVYYSLFSDEYGFLCKRRFIREEFNTLKINVRPSIRLDQPYYLARNERIVIDSSIIGLFRVGIPDMLSKNPQHDYFSLKQKLEKHKVGLTKSPSRYIPSFLIVDIKENSLEFVKKLLNGVNFYPIINNEYYSLNSQFSIFFSKNLNWKEDSVRKFLFDIGIDNIAYLTKSQKNANYSWIACIEIGDINDVRTRAKINEIMCYFEIEWISSDSDQISWED